MTNPAPQETTVALRDAIADALAAEWERLSAYLERRLGKSADDLDDALDQYGWSDFAEDLQAASVLMPLGHAYQAGVGAAEMSLGIVWNLRDPRALLYAQTRAAEMAGMRRLPSGRLVPNPDARWSLTDTTRDELRGLVVGMLESGTSWRDLKTQIEAMPEFSGLFGEARAEMIARTETALAANAGQFDTGESRGLEYATAHDSPECGLRNHHDPEKPNGRTYPLSVARQYSLSHPHCVRGWSLAPRDYRSEAP